MGAGQHPHREAWPGGIAAGDAAAAMADMVGSDLRGGA